mmetsp:Transcript_6711/g.15560  ORF Transcript_6711/g.15560 Transcript_6711/m.15560 type:complete len:264 (+) Transcript_6711:47-838(+)
MGCCGSTPTLGEISTPPGIEQLLGHRYLSVSQALDMNQQAITMMGRSFAGTATTDPEGSEDWVLGPSLKGKWDDPRRQLMFTWLRKADWACAVARGGFVLGARNTDGSVGAAVVVLPYFEGAPSELANTLELLQALFPLGMPPWREMDDAWTGIRRRAFSTFNIMEEVKAKHCTGPHAHVRAVAVDPSSQGRGFCGKLMRAVSAWADSKQLPLWLDTSGSRNVAIYERFGYKVVEKYQLECKEEPQSEIHEEEYAMIRIPATG